MNTPVTGGAGYLSCLTTLWLMQAGQRAVAFDNFCNGRPSVLGTLRTFKADCGRDLNAICDLTWRWSLNNLQGYQP